jgi:hypothetical protein
LGRLAEPEEYASLAVYLASDGHCLVGPVLSPNGSMVMKMRLVRERVTVTTKEIGVERDGRHWGAAPRRGNYEFPRLSNVTADVTLHVTHCGVVIR